MAWLLLILLIAQAPPAADLASAAKALEAEKYAEAAAILEKLVAADPSDFRARFNLAFAYTQLHRDPEAIEQYGKVVAEQPELAPARLNLGILLLRQKQPAAAVAHLEAAAAKKPEDFRAAYYLGEALLASGETTRAEGAYRRALELDARSAAARLGLARSVARADRLEEAGQEFRRAAGTDPEFRDALLELADLLEQKRRPAEALELYLEFLKARPDAVAVRERAGVLLLHTQRYEEAIAHLEPAVRQAPTPANQAALAQGYTMTKQPAKALPLLRAAVAAEPADPDLRFRLATALLEAADFAGAAREFLAALEKKPQSMETWNGLAFSLYRTDNFPGALQALDRARALGPEPPGNHYLRAIMLDKLHQYPVALESYQKFLAAAAGKYPDDEFKARQRVRILTKMIGKR